MWGLDSVFVYLDDILIASPVLNAHLVHLHDSFIFLQGNGHIICPDKCIFGQAEVDIVGHHLGAASILLSMAGCRPSMSFQYSLSLSCGISLVLLTLTIALSLMLQHLQPLHDFCECYSYSSMIVCMAYEEMAHAQQHCPDQETAHNFNLFRSIGKKIIDISGVIIHQYQYRNGTSMSMHISTKV